MGWEWGASDGSALREMGRGVRIGCGESNLRQGSETWNRRFARINKDAIAREMATPRGLQLVALFVVLIPDTKATPCTCYQFSANLMLSDQMINDGTANVYPLFNHECSEVVKVSQSVRYGVKAAYWVYVAYDPVNLYNPGIFFMFSFGYHAGCSGNGRRKRALTFNNYHSQAELCPGQPNILEERKFGQHILKEIANEYNTSSDRIDPSRPLPPPGVFFVGSQHAKVCGPVKFATDGDRQITSIVVLGRNNGLSFEKEFERTRQFCSSFSLELIIRIKAGSYDKYCKSGTCVVFNHVCAQMIVHKGEIRIFRNTNPEQNIVDVVPWCLPGSYFRPGKLAISWVRKGQISLWRHPGPGRRMDARQLQFAKLKNKNLHLAFPTWGVLVVGSPGLPARLLALREFQPSNKPRIATNVIRLGQPRRHLLGQPRRHLKDSPILTGSRNHHPLPTPPLHTIALDLSRAI